MTETIPAPSRQTGAGVAASAFGLGFALSGFFDGVLLHQILQWHHLLSGYASRGAPFASLGFQIAADGWFHLGMYLVAAASVLGLALSRKALSRPGAGRSLAVWALAGFGAWHVADALLSHWALGLHRIRQDAAQPLLWDLGWLAAFGFTPLISAALIARFRRPADARSGREATGLLLALALGGATLGAGGLAARPPASNAAQFDIVAVVFAPTIDFDRALRAAATAGTVVGFDGSGLFLIRQPRRVDALQLYARGAVFVGGGGMAPAGCFAWARTG